MEEERPKMQQFDGKNFDNWKFMVELVLDEKGVKYIVETKYDDLLVGLTEGPPDETAAAKRAREAKRDIIVADNKKTKRYIAERIKIELLEIVKGCASAFDMWQAMKNRYEKTTMAGVITLTKKFQNLKYHPNHQDFQDFCTEFDKIIRELDEVGTKYDAKQQVIHFLIAMPPDYDSVVMSLRTIASTQDLIMEVVRQQIEEFEDIHRGRKK